MNLAHNEPNVKFMITNPLCKGFVWNSYASRQRNFNRSECLKLDSVAQRRNNSSHGLNFFLLTVSIEIPVVFVESIAHVLNVYFPNAGSLFRLMV